MSDKNQFENIRQLNGLINSSGEISNILNQIKGLRRRLDDLIIVQHEKINARNEKDALKKEALKPPPPPEKKTVKTTPTEEIEVKTEIKSEPIVENQQVKPKVADRVIEPEVSKSMPSYIRGMATPLPPKTVKTHKPYEKPNYGTGGGGHGAGGAKRPYSTPYNPNYSKTGTGGTARPPFNNSTNKPFGSKPAIRPTIAPPIINKERKVDKKKEYTKADEKKSLNKRTLIRKGFITENLDEQRMGSRKLKVKKNKEYMPVPPKKIEKAIITTENLTVKILSEKIGKTATEIIKHLMTLGIMTTINSVVDFPTMELVANELGVELELKLEQTKESMLEDMHDELDNEVDLEKRPPIITVMGHVDHGKTSLLDAIRKTSVVMGEAGGITQHIGAYSTMAKNERITFLDTPGHEAFTALRSRGAKVTDIAILVVAADDGIMPQTVEAINHAKAAQVPIIVAINKIDKQGADVEKIKQELTSYNLVPEDWGGDTIIVPISAKKGDGIDKLLEMILLLAEINNYRANPNRNARGLIIESKLDKGKGPIANVIIQNGTLRVGDFVVSGLTSGRVRAMVDDKGRSIKEASPSTPISILGFTSVPIAGDGIYVVDDEKMAKQVIEERNVKLRNDQMNTARKTSLDELMDKINEGQLKELDIIIKGDVQGSVEALKGSLSKITSDEVKLRIIHAGVGAINKSDVMLAEVSEASGIKSIIIGFNVRPDAESKTLAEKSNIDIKLYKIIYEAIDDIEKAMKGMLSPKYKESILGKAQVRNVFKITNVGIVAGSYILSGKIQRGSKARIYRDGEMIFESSISGLKRFKDDVKEVNTGFECGISIANFSDFKENDEIESYIVEEIKAV